MKIGKEVIIAVTSNGIPESVWNWEWAHAVS